MRRRVFVYGTLVVPEVVQALIGRLPPGEIATLPGFVRGLVRRRPYPAIREQAGAETPGRVYEGVTAQELRLLDRFEGRLYRRRSVQVVTTGGRELLADVYVVRPRHRHALTARAWDAEEFRSRHLSAYVAHCTALRRGFRGGVG